VAANFTAFMDDSMDGGENDARGRRTVWSVAIVIQQTTIASVEQALEANLVRVFPALPRPIPEVHFADFVGDRSEIPNSHDQCRDLMTVWRRTLAEAEARIVARGIYTKEVTKWIGRADGGRSPYDVAYGHTLQHLSRVADGRVDVVHDAHGNPDELRATFNQARARGVYARRFSPCANLGDFAYSASSASRILQAADMYAWCFQRVWAKAPSKAKGAHAAAMPDRRSELARRLLADSKPLIAHRRVWRPQSHARKVRAR
jgi:hypothetical protein